jgi:hypothetical protein
MPTTPNRHFFTYMKSGSRLSPINHLKYGTWVKFALALLREKGQVGGLGAQRRTPRSFSSAIDPVAFSTISHEIGLTYIGLLRNGLGTKIDATDHNDSIT